jgi:hypothetical protein
LYLRKDSSDESAETKHIKPEKLKKLKQTQNGHFGLPRHASLIPIYHIINNEYICNQRNNKNKNKTKKCIDFQIQKLLTQSKRHV